MARKWQRKAALTRKRLMPTVAKETDGSLCSTLSVASRGHCIVYSADGRRFEVPRTYLGSMVLCELLSMSQEEFAFAGNECKIMLPCDAVVMEYVMCLLRRSASEEVEKAFLSSVVIPCQHSSYRVPPVALHQQFAVCSS